MIRIVDEGEILLQKGINIMRIYDGGWAVIIRIGRAGFYFRRRGKSNSLRPRHIVDWTFTEGAL